MKNFDFKNLTDKELQEEFQKIKPSPFLDAFLIGLLIGIIIFSVIVNSWGFLTLIPLFLIYLFLKKSKKYQALKQELDNRKLKLKR